MPINRKNVPNWYNSIPENNPGAFWERFDPDKLKTNEIECGDAVLAKIPNLPGRISRRNKQNGDHTTRYIELILEHSYDKDKKQSRNKRVIIGTDISHVYRGMMIINEKYHDYFDRQGNLIYRQEEQIPPSPDNQTQHSGPREPEKTPEQPEEQKTPTRYAADRKTAGTPDINTETALETDTEETPDDDTGEDPEGEDEIIEMLQQNQRRKDRLEYLNNILVEYKNTIDEQAKRRPDKSLTAYQIRRINELLSEIQELLAEYETGGHLLLAEEPDQSTDNPPMTYADMALLLSSYYCTLFSYRMGRLWQKQRTQGQET